MRSDKVEHPKYPDQGYLKYITEMSTLSYKDYELKPGTYYYSITVLTKHGKEYSNAVQVTIAGLEEDILVEEETPVKETNNETQKPTVNYTSTLTHIIDENDTLILSWNEYPGSDLLYYKVVYSKTNSNPQYPEDGYLEYMTDKTKTSYSIPVSELKEGILYFRISTILQGFDKDKAPEKRINSNVVTVENVAES